MRIRDDALQALAVLAAISSLTVTSATAANLVPAGTKGTLRIEVKVEGAGRQNSESAGAGWDYIIWKVMHEATLTVPLVAQDPTVGGSALAGVAPSSDGDEEDDSDWESVYDDRLDACNGDETCEMQVTMEKMQDPHMKGTRETAAAAMAQMQAGKLSFEPNQQTWSVLGGDFSGPVKMKDSVETYGMVEPGGGPKTDSHCHLSGSATLKPQLTGYGDLHPVLTVNAKDSTYQLTLSPVNQAIDIFSDCDPEHQGITTSLPGYLDEGSNWEVTGQLSGSADQPTLNGTKVFQTHLYSGAPGRNRPLTVQVNWKFHPGQ